MFIHPTITKFFVSSRSYLQLCSLLSATRLWPRIPTLFSSSSPLSPPFPHGLSTSATRHEPTKVHLRHGNLPTLITTRYQVHAGSGVFLCHRHPTMVSIDRPGPRVRLFVDDRIILSEFFYTDVCDVFQIHHTYIRYIARHRCAMYLPIHLCYPNSMALRRSCSSA